MNRRTIAAALTTAALVGVALAAPAQAAPPDRTAAVTAANDWNGDGVGDLAALTRGGSVYVFLGAGTGRFARTPQLVATGLRGFDLVRIAGDVDEDGSVDIITRSAAGALFLLRGGEGGRLAGTVRIAGDWSSYEEILPVDVNVDGVVDLVGRDRDWAPQVEIANTLRLYVGEPGTTFRASGWNPMGRQQLDQLTAWGDGDGDGYQEVVVRDQATGRLHALETRGTYTLFQANGAHRLLGTGWNGFTAIVSTGDVDSDGDPDLLARTADGTLMLYRSVAGGGLGRPSVVGTGFGSLTIG